MDIDEQEWVDQERGREGADADPQTERARVRHYRLLWRLVRRQPMPELPPEFADRVALLASMERSDGLLTDRNEAKIFLAMVATLSVSLLILSALYGTAWLRPLFELNQWVDALILCSLLTFGWAELRAAGPETIELGSRSQLGS